MIRLTSLAIVTLLAAEPQFVPLQEYLTQPGVTNDPVAAGYVAERCAAWYAVWAKLLENETDLIHPRGSGPP